MNTETILVAGASGKLGYHIVSVLKSQGHSVRVVARNVAKLNGIRQSVDDVIAADLLSSSAQMLEQACAGVDAIISAAGANMNLGGLGNRLSFFDVDVPANRNLLNAARKAGVKKFVYVSAFGAQTLKSSYTDAHEQFVAELERSGMKHTVVRPTGFFYFNGEFVTMAKRGSGMVIGSGAARTNPIHEADVAEICVQALASSEQGIDCGGPETFTRREIVELAFKAVGKTPRLMTVPPSVYGVFPVLARPINPRIADLLDFGGKVATSDCVAPALGKRRMEEYFNALALETQKKETQKK